MSITKFFRKYNRQLLAIFVVGLMIVFLLPASLRQIFTPNPLKRVVGQAYDEDIRLYDRNKTELETQILNALNNSVVNEKKNKTIPFNWMMFVQFSKDPILDYYLLIKEAEHTGITILQEQIDQEIARRGIAPQYVNAILKAFDVPLRTIREAVKHYITVEHLFSFALSTVKVSEPELKSAFINTFQRIQAYILPLRGKYFIDQIKEPDEKTITAYFAKNQERFRFPDRIMVEYLEADLNEIAKSIKVSKQRARQYWSEHKSKFTKTITTQPTTSPTTTQTTKPVKKEVVMSFKEAYPLVVERLKYIKARERALTAMAEIKRIAQGYWRNAPRDRFGLKQKPDKIANYVKLAEEISKKYNIKIKYHKTGLISQKDAAKLKGIGQAFIIEHNRPIFFYECAFRVVPLISPPHPDNRDRILFLVPWQDSPGILRRIDLTTRKDIGYYLFRVIKVERSRLPNSLDEVKNKIIVDYKEYKGYELSKKYADKLKSLAYKEKLDKLIKSSKDSFIKKLDLPNKEIEPITFSRRTWGPNGEFIPPYIAGVQRNRGKFIDECFSRLWNQPTTQPDGKFTTIVITDDEDRSCYVVQLVNKYPAKEEDYTRVKPMLYQLMLRKAQWNFSRIWLAPENIHKRTRFQQITER